MAAYLVHADAVHQTILSQFGQSVTFLPTIAGAIETVTAVVSDSRSGSELDSDKTLLSLGLRRDDLARLPAIGDEFRIDSIVYRVFSVSHDTAGWLEIGLTAKE